jgi:hypothetical protein
MPRCRLCLNVRELRRSHVLPEFFYRDLYEEESHRYVSVSSHPRHRAPLSQQKGLRERLLCQECEQRFSRIEGYAATFLGRVSREADAIGRTAVTEPVARVAPFEYATFKLFGLSLLWRMGESTVYMFSSVNLGPHREPLRRMLLSDDPGEAHEYPFALVRIAGVDFAPTLITAPGRTRFGGVWAYMLTAMGFQWVFLASRQTARVGQHPFFVGSSRNVLIVPVHRQGRDEFIRELVSHVPALARNR